MDRLFLFSWGFGFNNTRSLLQLKGLACVDVREQRQSGIYRRTVGKMKEQSESKDMMPIFCASRAAARAALSLWREICKSREKVACSLQK